MRTKWCAALVGGYVTTASALTSGGALLHFTEARAVRRTLWLSPQFQDRHPKIVSILHALAVNPEVLGSMWTLRVSEQPTTKRATLLVRKGETMAGVKKPKL